MYPVNLNLKGKPCLVIGGGHVAARKIRRLLEENAEVTLVAPELIPVLEKDAEEKRLHWEKRNFRPGDEENFHLVITASGNEKIASYLKEKIKGKFFLYNAADFPRYGNIMLPSRFYRGRLMIAVSTEGQSPAMSKYVRQYLEREVPETFGLWLERVSVLREKLKKETDSPRQREIFWRTAFSGDIINLVVQGNFDEAEERLRHAISRIGP